MLWLLLGCVYLKPRTIFVSHSLPGSRYTKKSREMWHKLSKGIFYTIEHYAQYVNRGNYLERGIIGVQGWTLTLVSRWWTIVLCIFFSLCFISFHNNNYSNNSFLKILFSFISFIKLVLSQLLILLLILLGLGVSELVLHCQLGLNHKKCESQVTEHSMSNVYVFAFVDSSIKLLCTYEIYLKENFWFSIQWAATKFHLVPKLSCMTVWDCSLRCVLLKEFQVAIDMSVLLYSFKKISSRNSMLLVYTRPSSLSKIFMLRKVYSWYHTFFSQYHWLN